MDNKKIMAVIMGIITHSGDAKSHAMEAIKAAREGDFEKADDSIKQAERAFVEAHHSQTALLTKEAQGRKQRCHYLWYTHKIIL